jgi:SpoVK/Ycf46/Vps4 family AAA+-type ATPase
VESLKEIKTWLQQPTKEKNSKGLAVLFDGPQTSGKWQAAEILAKETGKELHRVDLSQAVSKYIGETEKNLQQVFARAKEKNWILFFDEADALFGKRTDVKDSHDRYANLETNFLLQQIETHQGLVILSTNKKHNLDPAFLRRLRAVLTFPGK